MGSVGASARFNCGDDDLREFCNSLVPKNLLWRDCEASFCSARDELDAENRIATHLEKIVVNTYILHVEKLRPYTGQNFLCGTARCQIWAIRRVTLEAWRG